MEPLRSFSNRRGAVLVIAVAVMSILCTVVLLFSALSLRRLKNNKVYTGERQALYAAEAGVELFCYSLKREFKNKGSNFGGGFAGSSSLYSEMEADGMDPPFPYEMLTGESYTYRPFSDSMLGTVSVSARPRNGFLYVTSTNFGLEYLKSIRYCFGAKPPAWFGAALVLKGSYDALKLKRSSVNGKAILNCGTEPPKALSRQEALSGTVLPFNNKVFRQQFDDIVKIALSPDSLHTDMRSVAGYGFDALPDFKADSVQTHIGRVVINGTGAGRRLVIRGPGIIEAAGGIQVSGEVDLEDVTLVTEGELLCLDNVRLRRCTLVSMNRVLLGNRAEVSGGILCKGRIEIVNNARVLPYSMLYAFTDGFEALSSDSSIKLVYLDEDVDVAGTIIVRSRNSVVYVGSRAQFTGVIYTQGGIDIRGQVNGCVVARSFHTREKEDEQYGNIFHEGRIDREALPVSYVLPFGLSLLPTFEEAGWEILE